MISNINNKKGFTLIELLVVIAIVSLLASVILASLNSTRAKARDSKRIQDMGQVRTALELYFSTNGRYPIANANSAYSHTCTDDDYIPGLVPTYIAQLPHDPFCGNIDGDQDQTLAPDPGTCITNFNDDADFFYYSNMSGSDYKFANSGCFETDTYTALGKTFYDPLAGFNNWPAYGAVYSSGGAYYGIPSYMGP